MSEAPEQDSTSQSSPMPVSEHESRPIQELQTQSSQSNEHISFDYNYTSQNNEEPSERKTIPLWLIVLGMVGGMAAGVLMALFM